MESRLTLAMEVLLLTLWITLSSADPLSPLQLLNQGLTALGGNTFRNITGVTYQTTNIYRSYTLMENTALLKPDTSIATTGSQNISFQFSNSGCLSQRIDRFHDISSFWYWANPLLVPRDYSLVVKSGNDGFACYVKGNNRVLAPSEVTQGYAEPFLAEYLIHEMFRSAPTLLLQISSESSETSTVTINGVDMPSIYDKNLDISVIFDPITSLPSIVRSTEQHKLFGLSNRDLYLINYTSVDGVLFPHRFTTLYNGRTIEDYDVSLVTINPSFPADFFAGLPSNASTGTPTTPEANETYTHAEVGEFHANMMWFGPYGGKLENMTVETPLESLTNFWRITFNDAPTYSQMVIAFKDAVIVTDAPPHQTELVQQWVQQNIGRPITHVWPTHHHHDHTYGMADFVALGAKIIAPEISADFYSAIPGADVIRYNETHPFIYRDDAMQVRFIWHPDAPHSEDWGYGILTSACPDQDGPIAILEADVWSPGFPEAGFNTAPIRQWLKQIIDDGVSANSIVTPAHGITTPFKNLTQYVEFQYPNITTRDWKVGGPLCSN